MEKKQMTLLCFQNCFQNRDVWYKLRGLRNTDELFIDFADIEKAVNFFLPSLIKNPQKIRILNIEANINRYSMCYKFYQDFLFHARPERVNINLYYSHKMAYVKYSVYPRIVYAIRISRENDAVKFSRIVTTEDTQIMANHLQFWKLENETTECLISDDFCLNNGRIIEMSEYLVKSPNLPKIVRHAVNWHITYGRMSKVILITPFPPNDWKFYVGARAGSESSGVKKRAGIPEVPKIFWKVVKTIFGIPLAIKDVYPKVRVVAELRPKTDEIGVQRSNIVQEQANSFGDLVEQEY